MAEMAIQYTTNVAGSQFYVVDDLQEAAAKLKELDAAYARKGGITMSYATLVVRESELLDWEEWFDPDTGDSFEEYMAQRQLE